MLEALAAAVGATIEKTPTPLSEFLASLPGSWEMQIFYGLMLSGFMGMVAHYFLKWARDEIKGMLFCYLWINKKKVALSMATFATMAWTAAFNGAFVGDFGGFVGWKMVLSWGWGIGLSIDVIVNKSDRQRWTLVERLARKEQRERASVVVQGVRSPGDNPADSVRRNGRVKE